MAFKPVRRAYLRDRLEVGVAALVAIEPGEAEPRGAHVRPVARLCNVLRGRRSQSAALPWFSASAPLQDDGRVVDGRGGR
jgi:hypothetical protein